MKTKLRFDPRPVRHFLGPNPAVVPKPIDDSIRCNLGHLTPKTLQKALYVGVSKSTSPHR